MKKPEVLAPAGDAESLHFALTYGADAVYLGGNEFGMRAAAANFSIDTMKQAIDKAHDMGKKVYVTCNTLPRNDEVARMPAYLQQLESIGVDALIVSDVGVLMMAKEHAPNTEIHISTQAGVVNYQTANALYQLGARRVVLARELTLEEIQTICENIPKDMDVEVFVHGAMCMSFSGRCLLSDYFTHRDANRGACSQPCRWGYHLVEEKRPGEYFPVFEDENGSYILNAKDLCLLEYIDALIKAGVTSLKIEGRGKAAYYTAVVTNAYRMATDLYCQDPANYKLPAWLMDEVCKVSHRRYSTGFLLDTPTQYYENGGYLREYDVVAIVDRCEDGMLYCTQKNKFLLGDELEVVSPHSEPAVLTVDALYGHDDQPLESAPHPEMKLKIPTSQTFAPYSFLRKARTS